MNNFTTMTETPTRVSAERTTRKGKYLLNQAVLRDLAAVSNAKLLQKSQQSTIAENDLEYGFPYSNELAQFFDDSELTFPLELQLSRFEKSMDSWAFRLRSKKFYNGVIATRETYYRIARLKELAANEKIEVSAGSGKDLRSFLSLMEITRRPYVALLDNGNFRAVWKNADGEQIGLQFRGRGIGHYVLFALRSSDRFMAQTTGRDTLHNIQRQIDVQGLRRLMTA